MPDIDENDLIPEIQQQIDFLNKEADGLETDIKKLKNVYEELDLLKLENEDLKERLTNSETKHNEFVTSFSEFMKKRDDALKFLLQEVKNLNDKINGIRTTVGNKDNA